jgi:beta-glucosidase/6-phospho-beta-glucosidase/beta-galactosidase
MTLIDVNDTVEIVNIESDVNYCSLRIGQRGKVVAVCDGYCVWVKFDNYNPSEQPSKQYGFCFYEDELRKVINE